MKRAALALFFVLVALFAYASTPLPQPTGYVSDYADVMSAETKDDLEQELALFNATTTNEIAVVTVNSLEGDYIEHYAEQLFKLWGIGTATHDNGVLLLLAINDHKLRIEVGYGLEGALPDSVAASIIADMTPLLKEDDYDGAIALGTHEIMQATAGEYHPSAQHMPTLPVEVWFSIVVFGVFALQWLAAILARSNGVWLGGIVGGLAGIIMSSYFGWWVAFGVGATVALGLVGVAFDALVSGSYKAARASGVYPPWWSGGSGGSSSGGFGGFGGGSSGGGGASGSW